MKDMNAAFAELGTLQQALSRCSFGINVSLRVPKLPGIRTHGECLEFCVQCRRVCHEKNKRKDVP